MTKTSWNNACIKIDCWFSAVASSISTKICDKYTCFRLIGNPVCKTSSTNPTYCQVQQSEKPYSTSLANCGTKTCPPDERLNPQSCDCAFPFEGTLYFRGSSFIDVSNADLFHTLEMALWTNLVLPPGSVYLQNPFSNTEGNLQVHVAFFPSTGKFFNRTEVLRIGFDLNNQTLKPPKPLGPYYFIASPYAFPGKASLPG